jgi:mono/diheme cytochrome c family protein
MNHRCYRREVIVLRTCLALTLACVLSGTLSAQETQSPKSLTPVEKTGRSIFQTRCAMCHVGQEPASEMAASAPAAERKASTLGPLLSKANTTDETRLRTKIANGSRLMPGYKHTLNDAQVDQVIAFMKTVDQPMTRLTLSRPGE